MLSMLACRRTYCAPCPIPPSMVGPCLGGQHALPMLEYVQPGTGHVCPCRGCVRDTDPADRDSEEKWKASSSNGLMIEWTSDARPGCPEAIVATDMSAARPLRAWRTHWQFVNVMGPAKTMCECGLVATAHLISWYRGPFGDAL